MAEIKGGWSYTAFSNDEPYSRAFVNGFSRVFSAMRMENLGTYPGNARNSMLQQNDDQYVELGNIAVLQSHGSVWGPDLEFLPSTFGTWWYNWGDKHKLQWVLIGGCDCLGYSTYPNGEISDYHPRVDRWDRVFDGISGVLGYRSDSYYSPNDINLADRAGVHLASRLVNGATFVDAWRSTATYVHRSLGRRAEMTVFASSVSALSDNLRTFEQSRPIGLDQRTISTYSIGTGSGPTFRGYCPNVDYDGTYTCDPNFYNNDARTEIASGIFASTDLQTSIDSLPEFSLVENSGLNVDSKDLFPDLIEVCNPVIRLNESTDLLSSQSPEFFGRLNVQLEKLLNHSFSDCSKIKACLDDDSANPPEVCVGRFVVQDGEYFPVLCESGLVSWQSDSVVNLMLEFRGSRFSESNVRSIGFSESDLHFIFRHSIFGGATITVLDSKVCYRFDPKSIKLKPCIALYIAARRSQSFSTYVYFH